MRTVTPFDTSQHHIHAEFYVADQSGRRLRFDGVIDTGAPWTEFSDEFLARAGLVELSDDEIPIKPGPRLDVEVIAGVGGRARSFVPECSRW